MTRNDEKCLNINSVSEIKHRLNEQSELIMLLKSRVDEESDQRNLLESRLLEEKEKNIILLQEKADNNYRFLQIQSENCLLRRAIDDLSRELYDLKSKSYVGFDSVLKVHKIETKCQETNTEIKFFYDDNLKNQLRCVNEQIFILSTFVKKLKQQKNNLKDLFEQIKRNYHLKEEKLRLKFEKLIENQLSSHNETISDLLEQHLNEKQVVQMELDNLSLQITQDKELHQMTLKTLESIQNHNKTLENNLSKIKIQREKEQEAYNTNKQIKKLKLEVEDLQAFNELLRKEFDAYKIYAKQLLDNEKKLNHQLRQSYHSITNKSD